MDRGFAKWLLWVVFIALFVLMFIADQRIASIFPKNGIFTTYWQGTRSFLFDGTSPYSTEVITQTHELIYGHQPQVGDFLFTSRFPLYATIFYAPFALVGDYELAMTLWVMANQLAMLAALVLTYRVFGYRPNLWQKLFFGIFAVVWVHGFLSVIQGGAIAWVFLFLVIAIYMIKIEKYELAGIFLAFTTIQILPIMLVVLFIVLYAIFRRNWLLLTFFIGTLSFLIVATMFVIPDWPIQYLRLLFLYPEYPPPENVTAALVQWWPGVGRQLGWAINILLGSLLLVEWWLARKKDLRWFLWTLCLTLVINQWFVVTTSPVVFSVLLLPLMLIFYSWQERNLRQGYTLSFLCCTLLILMLWPLYIQGYHNLAWPQVSPLLLIPAPFIVLTLLFWVRWWSVRPRRFYEELLSSDLQ